MFRQAEPGDDIIDLRDVLEKYNEILSRAEEDKEEWEFDYLASVDDLSKQLYSSLEDAADNEPTMILESYFERYAQEVAEDIGAISNPDEWPNYCIDWERAARELAMDYGTVEFGGYTYYIR